MNEFENIDYQLPYNPSDVDIRQQKFSVGQIVEMITHSDIDLLDLSDYQRNTTAWSAEQKSRLIESLIMRIPLPIFYFDGSERSWKVIDGLHRLITLYTFMRGASFNLKKLEFIKEIEGKTFFEIPFKYRRAIEESEITAYIINPGTPDSVKINIFHRINTGGAMLSRQEIRSAYYRGVAADFIKELSETDEFLIATLNRVSKSKMRDKEFALRFFAFYYFLTRYHPPMEKFLDTTMVVIRKMQDYLLADARNAFKKSMIVCNEIFNEKAFYMLNINGEKIGSSINLALFETWAVNIALLDSNQQTTLIHNKDKVLTVFTQLLQETEFYKSITAGTSSRKAVYTRFEKIKSLIQKITNDN